METIRRARPAGRKLPTRPGFGEESVAEGDEETSQPTPAASPRITKATQNQEIFAKSESRVDTAGV